MSVMVDMLEAHCIKHKVVVKKSARKAQLMAAVLVNIVELAAAAIEFEMASASKTAAEISSVSLVHAWARENVPAGWLAMRQRKGGVTVSMLKAYCDALGLSLHGLRTPLEKRDLLNLVLSNLALKGAAECTAAGQPQWRKTKKLSQSEGDEGATERTGSSTP